MNADKSKVMRYSRYGRQWIVLSTWGHKWQPMEDMKGMWYTKFRIGAIAILDWDKGQVYMKE